MEHGGDIYTEGSLKGKQLLDFSSNINPLGVPKGFTNNLLEAVKNIKIYPDIQYRESKSYICDYLNKGSSLFYPKEKILDFNFKQKDLVLGNGVGELIDIAIASVESICIVAPSFIEYRKSAQKNNVKITYSNLNPNMEIDYSDLAKKIERVDGLIIGNPNNPNGGIIDQVQFKPILDYCQRYEKRIIIDEAFIEFTGDIGASMLELARDYSCICIIKALTKFYGIPGVRLGYSVCKNQKYNKLMREKQIPWNINTFAELALKYVLEDKVYIEKTLKWIKKEREQFTSKLEKIKIIKRVYPTYGNFVLVKLNGETGTQLYNKLIKQKVLIRTCNSYEQLGDKYVRFAIKGEEENNKLIKILKNID